MSDEDELENEEEEEAQPGGLNLGRTPIIDEGKVRHAKEKIDNILRDVEADLLRRGIPEPPRPKNHPAELADMDTALLTNADLGSLYTQYVAYASYIGDELAKIEGMEESAKKLLRDTLAELKEAAFVRGLKGPEATSAAISDELYRALDLEHMRLFFMKAIMKRRYRGYVSKAAALSRTIELRKLDFEQVRRDGNIGFGGKRPATPGGFGAGKKR
jgi:hypothetical protein